MIGMIQGSNEKRNETLEIKTNKELEKLIRVKKKHCGIIPRCIDDLFKKVSGQECTVYISFL